jgi:hypothetical protein
MVGSRPLWRILAIALSALVVAVLGVLAIAQATAGAGHPTTGAARTARTAAPVTVAPVTVAPNMVVPNTVVPSAAEPAAVPPSTAQTAAAAPTGAAAAPSFAESTKKGVSTWQFTGLAGAMKDVGSTWYYNWGANNDAMPSAAEFVPMIWGQNEVTAANLAKVKTEGRTLLGFNEPDLAGQAEMTVERALDLWPQLQNTGMRLGSPAVAYGGNTPGGWLDRFMTGVKQRNLRVDFITLHWYGSDFSSAAVGHFMSYVKAVHDRYKLPIWITEYGLMNFTGEPKFPNTRQITAFITESTKQLEAAPYVERYAWFSLPAVGDSLPYGLYRDATTPTEAGKAYRAAGS